jgi:uncharacterized protein (DUF169 family)/NAD-dependent dihydropyrimidine dehydrogenase PreA subunit
MKIAIDLENCAGCGKCVEICPVNVFQMDVHNPLIANEVACTLCGVCVDQCPQQAIIIEALGDTNRFMMNLKGKEKYIEYNNIFQSVLKLKKKPVAIKLVRPYENVPKEIPEMDMPIRHCVSINLASYGAVFYLPKEKHACAAAKASLGIAELPEKVKNGQVPYMHGLAATQAAAACIMEEIPKLEPNSTTGTLVAPLDKAIFDPDVIILTVLPKQAMWIANSVLFETGTPRITANFAGMQASCGDATVLPIINNRINFSVGCYGCRSMGKLADTEMYVGIPLTQIELIINGLKGLWKAMNSLEKNP